MRVARLLLLLALLAPSLALAQGTNALPTVAALCKGTVYTGAPSSPRTFTPTEGDKLRSFINQVLYCTNPCFDLKVAFSVSKDDGSLTLKTTSSNLCADKAKSPKDQSPPRGCEKGQTQPKITAYTPPITAFGATLVGAQTIGPLSRCNDKIASIVSSMLGRSENSDLNGYKSDLASLQGQPQDVPPTVGAVNGDEQLSAALQGLGVPADKADQVVKDNPDQVQELLKKIGDKDLAGAQDIAKKLELNSDVQSKIAQLSPPQIEEIAKTADMVQAPEKTAPDTFPKQDEQPAAPKMQCGFDGVAGPMMLAESNCGKNTYSATTNVIGPLQYLCPTWRSYTAATGMGQYSDCNYANDPKIAADVTNARYDLFQQQYGTQCSSAGLSWSSCSYAIHVFGEGGFRNMLNAYGSNPDASATSLCGGALSSAACRNNISIFRNGGTVGGIFAELDRRQGIGNGSPTYGYQGSPFSGLIGGNTYGGYGGGVPVGYATPYGYGGSPFGSVSPVASGVSYTSAPVGVPTGGTNSVPVSQVISQSPGSGTTGSGIPTQSFPTPVATLIVQPKTVVHGNPLSISWSSIGMRVDTRCQIVITQSSSTPQMLAQDNDGSKTIVANFAGIVQVDMKCIALNGQSVTRSATVPVQ